MQFKMSTKTENNGSISKKNKNLIFPKSKKDIEYVRSEAVYYVVAFTGMELTLKRRYTV